MALALQATFLALALRMVALKVEPNHLLFVQQAKHAACSMTL